MNVDAQRIEHMMNPENYAVLVYSYAEDIKKNPKNCQDNWYAPTMRDVLKHFTKSTDV